jgi:hypothetical protein
VAAAPSIVVWTEHALAKVELLGLRRTGRGRRTTARVVTLRRGVTFRVMKIDGHYDERADIAWLRFDGYDPATVVSEEVEFGLREIDPTKLEVVGLEYWRASGCRPSFSGCFPRRPSA